MQAWEWPRTACGRRAAGPCLWACTWCVGGCRVLEGGGWRVVHLLAGWVPAAWAVRGACLGRRDGARRGMVGWRLAGYRQRQGDPPVLLPFIPQGRSTSRPLSPVIPASRLPSPKRRRSWASTLPAWPSWLALVPILVPSTLSDLQAQLGLNFAWSPLFFRYKNLKAASLEITGGWVETACVGGWRQRSRPGVE